MSEIVIGKLFPADVDQIVHFGLMLGPQDCSALVYLGRYSDEMGSDEAS